MYQKHLKPMYHGWYLEWQKWPQKRKKKIAIQHASWFIQYTSNITGKDFKGNSNDTPEGTIVEILKRPKEKTWPEKWTASAWFKWSMSKISLEQGCQSFGKQCVKWSGIHMFVGCMNLLLITTVKHGLFSSVIQKQWAGGYTLLAH